MWWLLMTVGGCTGDGGATGERDTDTGSDADGDTDNDTDTDTDGDTDTDTTAIDVPADNIATIAGDCLGRFRTPDDHPNQLIEGDELERYTLRDPEAVCNDGSRATLYVRAATSEALADVWEIHLQGGGACGNWADCAVRWCGLGYYDASKMSSRWNPPEVGAVGIFDADGANLLAGANHAYFYYCSSDSWAGQGSATYDVPDTLTGDTGATEDLPDLPTYTMFRRGRRIVESGIAELEAGLVGDLGGTMPALAEASIVVFNGTSAGSTGAKVNADWLTERLAPNGTRVLAVFDAANSPPVEFWPAELQDAARTRQQDAFAYAEAVNDPDDFVDESCAAIYGTTGGEAWRCGTADWVLANHITTPFFVRQDLRDLGGLAEAVALPEDDHERAVVDALAALRSIGETAVEATSITVAPGVYGPNCAQHVGAETVDWWRVATVADADGVPYTFQDAVMAWYLGSPVALVDDPVVGAGDGPRSVCASVDEEH